MVGWLLGEKERRKQEKGTDYRAFREGREEIVYS